MSVYQLKLPQRHRIDSDSTVHMRCMGWGKGIPVNEMNSANIVIEQEDIGSIEK
jgi:hypothetical protein